MVTIAMITLWLCQQFAIENDPVETIDLPLIAWWVFPVRYVNVYQRV